MAERRRSSDGGGKRMSEDWSGWVPILPTADAQRSVRFYCDLLGFTQDWEHRFGEGFPLYVQVSRGTVSLHLNEHGDADQSTSLCIGVRDVNAVYAELTRIIHQDEGVSRFRIGSPGVAGFGWC